jgi:hypothetical protein
MKQMKKKLFFLLAMFLIWNSMAQKAPIYSDDFESYNIMDYLAVDNPTWWTTWNNQPGTMQDARISGVHASSGTNSVVVLNATDLLLKLGNRTTGKYNLSWNMYVENNYEGYYNIQHFQSPGIEWAFETWFLYDGSGRLYAGSGTPYTFSYPPGTWFPVENIIDLDNDMVKLVINGVTVLEWPFHYTSYSSTGTKSLGAVDFWAGYFTPDKAGRYYFDDVNFMPYEAPPIPLSGWAIAIAMGLIVLATLLVWWRKR